MHFLRAFFPKSTTTPQQEFLNSPLINILTHENHTYLHGMSLHIDSETQDILQQKELGILCSHSWQTVSLL